MKLAIKPNRTGLLVTCKSRRDVDAVQTLYCSSKKYFFIFITYTMAEIAAQKFRQLINMFLKGWGQYGA